MTVRSRLVLAALVPLALGLLLLWELRAPAPASGARGPGLSPSRPEGSLAQAPQLSNEAPPDADAPAALESVNASPLTRVEAFEPAAVLVCEPTGWPIADASVRQRGPDPAGAETDDEGRCELSVPGSGGFWFEVTADGYGGMSAFHYRKGQVRVELPPLVDVAGRVLDEHTRLPVPGASIRSWGGPRSLGGPRAVADAQGRFLLRGAPAIEELHLYASAEGYPERLSQWNLIEITEQAELELYLSAEVVLEVVLLDDNDAPLVGFEVGDQVTDGSGRASLALRRGEGEEDTVSFGLEAADFYEVWVQIEAGAPSPLEIRLPRPGRIEGLVRDRSGSPVGGASVEFDAEVRVGALPSFEIPHGKAFVHRHGEYARTDAVGRFQSPPLAPSVADYRVSARSSDYPVQTEATCLIEAGATTPLDLVLDTPGPYVRGTVRGQVVLNGEPVDADVVWRSGAAMGRIRTGGRRRLHGAPEGVKGAFEGAVPEGEAELWVEFEDHHLVGASRYLPDTRVLVQVVAGQVVEHVFEFELPMGQVGGRVTTADGKPLREGLVSVVDTEGRYVQRAYTDPDGRWRDEVPDLDWEYVASLRHAGVTARREGVRAGDLNVELTLPALGTLPVRVLDAKTAEVVQEWELSYRVRGEDRKYQGRELSPATNAARPGGWFPLELRPGVLDLWVQAPELGYQSRCVEGVRVTTGDNAPVEVRLERGLEQQFALAEGCERPRDHQVQLLLLEDELWDTVHHGDEIERGEPTIRFGNDAYQYGHGPHYSAGTLSTRMLHFDEHHRATLKGLAPGTWRFKAPAGVVVEPARVVLPHEGPLEVRWRRRD